MNSLEISTVKHATFDDTCLQMKVVPKIVDYSKVRPVPADAFVPQNRLMSFGIATWRQRLKFFFADQGQSIGRQSAECFKKNCLPQYDIDGGDCKNYLDFSAGSLEFDNLHSTINRLSTFKRSSEHLATMKRQFADIATQNFPTSRRKQDKNL